jgi:hypothetical protein
MRTLRGILDDVISDGTWNIDYADGYAEPGYATPRHGVYLADWNNETRHGTDAERAAGEHWPTVSTFRSRFADLLDRAGYAIEWSDEWIVCDCGKAVRIQPTGWGWTPSYVIRDGDFACQECWRDCLSVSDRIEFCAEMGISIFAARHSTVPNGSVQTQ